MNYRYTFFLPENGQIQTIIKDPIDAENIDFDLREQFVFVPAEQYDIFVSKEHLKCVTKEKVDQNQVIPAQAPEVPPEPAA